MTIDKVQQVAVIGAGIAGAACAHTLTLAGHSVHVFDKSRGPGGRLATRRLEWADRQGQACTTRLDHGAVGFTAQSHAFQAFVTQAVNAGSLAEWTPRLAAGATLAEAGERLYLPTPDMPALCRGLLEGASAHWSAAVDGLHHTACGWQVQAGSTPHPQLFDAVVLALPPAQAAPLLGPHRRDWARQASIAPMQPCWTLMGVADTAGPPSSVDEIGPAWQVARPATGPLAWVFRNESRPGRARVSGQAHWVAHARAGWSRHHLEQPAAWVQQQMQAALAECIGQPVEWLACNVHRWRYAAPQAQKPASAQACWWDAAQGLGVCGDFLGGSGVEGAWLSAQSLAAALLQRAPTREVTLADGGVQEAADEKPHASVWPSCVH